MRQLAMKVSTHDEAIAEARSFVTLALESLNRYAELCDASQAFALRDAAMRLASWHPYFLDRLNAAEVTSSDFDELNYILDSLFEMNRQQGSPTNASLIRTTLWLGRALRNYKEIAGQV